MLANISVVICIVRITLYINIHYVPHLLTAFWKKHSCQRRRSVIFLTKWTLNLTGFTCQLSSLLIVAVGNNQSRNQFIHRYARVIFYASYYYY